MKQNILFFVIGIALIICTSRAAMAQTPANPNIGGYYVSVGGQATGPYDSSGLRQLVNQGMLSRDTLVWKEGMSNWVIAGTVEELGPFFAPALPPPLPSAPNPGPTTPPPLVSTPPPVAVPEQTTPPASSQVQEQQPAPVYAGSGQKEPWGGSPFVAGLVNSLLGIWSWGNRDYFGGIVTSGLFVTGVVLCVVGTTRVTNTATNAYYNGTPEEMSSAADDSMGFYIAGMICGAVSPIFGFFRGITQYNKKMRLARSLAEAVDDNPMNHISLVALPVSGSRRFFGTLTYSLSF